MLSQSQQDARSYSGPVGGLEGVFPRDRAFGVVKQPCAMLSWAARLQALVSSDQLTNHLEVSGLSFSGLDAAGNPGLSSDELMHLEDCHGAVTASDSEGAVGGRFGCAAGACGWPAVCHAGGPPARSPAAGTVRH